MELSRRTVVVGGAALVVAGAGVAAGVASCTRGAADVPVEPTASGDDAEGASKLGGKLVLYSSCSESLINAAVARFSQDTGVTVNVVRGTEAELAARMAAGAAGGEPAADVVWGGEAEDAADAGEAGSATASKPVELQRELGVFAVASGLKSAPEGYADLSSVAAAKGVALCDPAACEAGWLHLVALLAGMGAADANVAWQYLRDLLAAGAVVCTSEDEAVEALLDDDVAVALLSEQTARQLARRTGEVSVVWPEEAIGCGTACARMLDGCRNEAQAQAFLDFLAGREGQQVLADALARPISDEVPASGGDGVPSDSDLEPSLASASGYAVEKTELLATWAAVRSGEWAAASGAMAPAAEEAPSSGE